MKRTKIESFAKEARNMLQDQIRSRIEQIRSGSYSIAAIERPDAVKNLNRAVIDRGLKNVVEEYAYTWFNRLCAIRFMDAHNYNQTLVLTPKEGRSIPEILADALGGVIDECVVGKDRAKIFGLLSGDVPSDNAQSEVFRILLVSKCKALGKELPYLFGTTNDDFSDILLPDDLLSSGSIIAKLLNALDDENCENVEVIGWLYQYYISERKDEVMKKKTVSKEDMAAATQLFTPDWIVRYLVENSIGRLWILNHPGSTLANKMEFYIKPAQLETEFVRIDNPEDYRICDPCCGSGHMLTYSFDILMEIYEEYGYSRQDAVASIIKNNLYGIELDKRAGQLTYFALMMKARENDRRFFSRKIEPNVCVLEAVQFSDADVHSAMEMFDKPSLFIMDMLKQFEQADTFGSLIVPTISDIDGLKASFEAKSEGYLFDHDLIVRIEKILKFSEYLSPRYNIVITNPPYLGKFDDTMKNFAKAYYPDSKSDEFAMFMERDWLLCVKGGYSAMVNMQSWMFLTSYEDLRKKILKTKTILSMIHIGARGFDSIGGEVVSTTAYISKNASDKDFLGQYFGLTDGETEAEKTSSLKKLLESHNKSSYFETSLSRFAEVDGVPFSYWASERVSSLFSDKNIPKLSDIAVACQGLSTSDNVRFVRFWYEPAFLNIEFACHSSGESLTSSRKWYPFNKGGSFRKWFGNNELVVNYQFDGKEMKAEVLRKYTYLKTPDFVVKNPQYYFRKGLTWSALSSGAFSLRAFGVGFLFADKGQSIFCDESKYDYLLAFFNSTVANVLLRVVSPTLDYNCGYVRKVPIVFESNPRIPIIVNSTKELAKTDWDSFETSWDFKEHPLVSYSKALWDGTSVAAQIDHYYGKHMPVSCPLELCFLLWQGECNERFSQLKSNEEELNRIFIDIYGLQEELTPEESDSDVTVRKADLKRDMQSFVSYAVGCMFGRYSLDYEGLAYAGGEWEESRYSTFKPDDDNVIPVLDDEWFSDDIVARFKEFVKVVFGSDTYDANLRYVEKALGRSLRDYFMKDFYSNHLKNYQKRPIYWMFSSPGGSFNALVYLHRYNKNTVDVVLKYLRDYKTKIRAQIAVLKGNNDAQSVRDLIKYDKIDKDLDEYEQMLYSLALKHVDLDLDDGVKVNYGKLGNALYPVDGLNREKK